MSVRLLALETSGTAGSVAAWSDGQLVAERWLPSAEKSAKTLAPAMHDLLREVGWRPAEVRAIGVVVGPGSFTGLRVGVTTAKTFAYAVRADVVAVNTLDVIAHQSPLSDSSLSTVIDAQRGQLYVADYSRSNNGPWQQTSAPAIIDIDAWLARLAPGTLVSGPAITKLAARLSPQVVMVDESWRTPSAATVAQLAAERYAAGQRDDLWRLAPLYLRRSAAEEKWEQRQQQKG